MPDYRVVITAHLDKWKLPPGGALQPEYDQVYNYSVETEHRLMALIETNIAAIVGSGAMQVYLDPSNIQVGKINQSFSIPLHMITHITWAVKLLQGESPYVGTDGKAFLKSGKDVVKH